MKLKRKTFGIIIIGNEVLSGKTLDTNSNYLCKELYEIGMECKEVTVIQDVEGAIIEKVNLFRDKYDFVFTTGGIGPTHDDITSQSISKAFNDNLVLNKIAKKRLEKHYSDETLTSARLKMAYLPSKSIIIDNPVSIAPGFSIENVHVFPGVPKIFQVMLKEFIKKVGKQKKFFKKNITTEIPEGIFAEFVGDVQKKYPDIEIGSYPFFHAGKLGVSIVLRSEDQSKIDDCSSEIKDFIKKKKIEIVDR